MEKASFLGILTLLFLIYGCQSDSPSASSFENPADLNSQFPYLYATNNSLYMSWISSDGDGSHSLNYSRYLGGAWDTPQTIARDSSWFVNWADFPSIIADQNGPLAIHMLNKKPGGPYAYDVNIYPFENVISRPPLVPHTDSTATEHGFVSMVPWDEDTILAVWLDGRQSADRTDEQYFDLDYAMTLRAAIISTSGEIKESFLIDDAVCDCCPTSLVKTPEGALVAYRGRTKEEIRDISISRFDGTSWSDPRTIHKDNWNIRACPVNGPALAAQDSLVVLGWYTGADDNPRVQAVLSQDGGNSFQDFRLISDRKTMGRVDATIQKGRPYLSFLEESGDQAVLKITSLDQNSIQSETVDTLIKSRQTGFPQMEAIEDKLILAWTAVSDTSTSIKTVQVIASRFD